MNLKQKKFIRFYLETGNATESAKRAGYSPKTAYSQGQRLLKNVEISKDLVSELKSKNLTPAYVLEHLINHAEHGSEPAQIRALELLGKSMGLFDSYVKKINEVQTVDISAFKDRSLGSIVKEIRELMKSLEIQQALGEEKSLEFQ